MCGIVGILSVETNWQIKSILYEAILELLNRGYDSMGVSILLEGRFGVRKALEMADILNFLKECKEDTRNGIAHTRWATHGGVNIVNAHPHVDSFHGEFALVHNGIIENFDSHKSFLLDKGVEFFSETDSEVIVNLLAYHFYHSFAHVGSQRDRLIQSLQTTLRLLEGTFGVIVQSTRFPENLFCARRGSPLLVGIDKQQHRGMIVSEKSGFLHHVEEYVSIQDNNIYCIEQKEGKIVYSCVGQDCCVRRYALDTVAPDTVPLTHNASLELSATMSTGLPSHTEKEILEQPESIRRCLNYGSRFMTTLPANSSSAKVKLGGLDRIGAKVRHCRHIYLFGCGTSYHVAQLGAMFFRRFTDAHVVLAYDASEFEVEDLPRMTEGSFPCACLFISQSGETLDLSRVMEKIDFMGPENYIKLGIVNVVDSLIARNVEAGVYMNCGRERGVASTKSFTASVIIAWLIAHWYAETLLKSVSLYSSFAGTVESFLIDIKPRLEGLVTRLFPAGTAPSSVLLLGKGLDYYVAREGSLKIKELCYVHAEAYPSGALKHGPFALLEENTVVVFLATDPDGFQKTRNALHEVTARKPRVLLLCTPSFVATETADGVDTVRLPEHPWSFLLANMALQYFALHLSLARNINPDFPRNLAKVVTVE
jgi:glucosamine--fructose-6-phosphate aminotransferase (isomerizing)